MEDLQIVGWDDDAIVVHSDQVGSIWSKLKKTVKKVGKTVGKVGKAIAKSPLVKVVATGAAFVVPVVGVPALAALQTANKLVDASKSPKTAKRALGVIDNTRKLAAAGDPAAKRAVGLLAQSARQRAAAKPAAPSRPAAPPRPAAPAVARVLRTGLSGADVLAWQRQLTAAGFRVAADGKFGASTHAATVAWQKRAGLPADGLVGPLARARMAQPRPAATAAKPAAKPEEITRGLLVITSGPRRGQIDLTNGAWRKA